MTKLLALTNRNIKLFFKDKGMFFTSLVTPLILLVLYATFLAEIYRDSFAAAMPAEFSVGQSLIDGTVGAQLFASLLAVCCVTVSFCSNMLMVQDRSNGTINDLLITPVKSSVLAMSYFFATLVSTLVICYTAMGVSFIYIGIVGWYLTVADILLLMLDVLLLVLFGTGLSSAIGFFLSTQGQISAVGTVVSAGYGFICGAYMPISQFSEGLQKIIMFLPGTHATSLLRSHAMRGVFEEMEKEGIPSEVMTGIKDSVDCNIYLFEEHVTTGTKYTVLCLSIVILTALYVLFNFAKAKKHSKKRK